MSKKYLILLLTIVTIAIVVVLYLFFTNSTPKAYSNLGASMQPTIDSNQTVYGFTEDVKNIERGDVIVFNSEVVERKQIKRVVGLPGDNVKVSNGKLVTVSSSGDLYDFGLNNAPSNQEISETVKEGYFYVVGDNLSNSLDSRSYGPIPISAYEATIDI